MQFIPGYNDPVRITWNTDANNSKVSVEMQPEIHKVAQNRITLIQVPDVFYRVSISGLSEVYDQHTEININQYRVDYESGIVMFHSSREGQSLTVSKYWGRGIVLTPASRIYTLQDAAGNVKETLQDIIDISRQAMTEFNYLVEAIGSAEALYQTMLATIGVSEAERALIQAMIDDLLVKKQILQNVIDDSVAKLAQLQTVINDSLAKKNSLQLIIDDSVLKLSQLQTVINDSVLKLNNLQLVINDSVVKKNNLQSVIDDSIVKLGALQLVIDDSVVKLNQLQTVINDSVVKRTELQNTINDSIVKNTTLNTSITTGVATNTILVGSIESAFSANGLINQRMEDVETGTAFSQTFISTGLQTFQLAGSYKDYQYVDVYIQGVHINAIEDFTLTTNLTNPAVPKYILQIVPTIPAGTEVVVHVHQTLAVDVQSYIIP